MSRREVKAQQGSGDEAEANGASSLFNTGKAARSLAASSRLDESQTQKALAGDYTPHDAWQDLGGS